MPRRPTPRIAPLDTDPRVQAATQSNPYELNGDQDFDPFENFDESTPGEGEYGDESWASQQAARSPRWAKWLLYGSMALGLLAAGMLIATALIQGMISGSLVIGGAEIFGDSQTSVELRRELIWGPLTLPLIILGVAFVGMCVGGLTIFRHRRAQG